MEDGCENYITFLTTPPSEKVIPFFKPSIKSSSISEKNTWNPIVGIPGIFLIQVLLKQSSIQFVGGFLFDFFQHFFSTSSCVFSLIMLPHATYFL